MSESSPAPSPSQPPSGFHLTIHVRRVLLVLAVWVTIVVALGAAANVVRYQVFEGERNRITKLADRFDLTHEPSLPQWYSSASLLSCAGLLLVIGLSARRRRDALAPYWFGLVFLFLGMSVDETIAMHELLVEPTRKALGLSGIFRIAWIVPGMAFVALVGAVYVRFLLRLDARTRWMFLLAGGLYVGGAIGLEMPGGVLYEKYEFATWHYITLYAFEEWLEMIAILTFLYALIDHSKRTFGPLTLDARLGSD